MEAELANGKTINIAEHSQLSSTLTRLASRIGLDRASLNVSPPSVESYLEHLAKQKQHDEAAARERTVEQRVDAVVEQHEEEITS